MGYLMLYGDGWTQRWEVAEESVPLIEEELSRVGRNETGHLPVIDPGAGVQTTLVVAWQRVAAAVILKGQEGDSTAHEETGGQYA